MDNMDRDKSVWHGKDEDIIPTLLNVHSPVNYPRILDVTYNQGVMWKKIKPFYNLVTMDIDPQFAVDVWGDFTALPFGEKTFDVIVFDPPHLPNAGGSFAGTIFSVQYGINNYDKLRAGDNVSQLFAPFLVEARRVLRPEGVVLAKIADLTHNHRYQWQHVDFINAVNTLGLTACDMLIKEDPQGGHLTSNKWLNVKHLRKSHCYWIVVRNSNHCEGPDKQGPSLYDKPQKPFKTRQMQLFDDLF